MRNTSRSCSLECPHSRKESAILAWGYNPRERDAPGCNPGARRRRLFEAGPASFRSRRFANLHDEGERANVWFCLENLREVGK